MSGLPEQLLQAVDVCTTDMIKAAATPFLDTSASAMPSGIRIVAKESGVARMKHTR